VSGLRSTRDPAAPAVFIHGRFLRLGDCASCSQYQPIVGRGLCVTCRWRHRADGTIGDYGYVKADRFSDYVLIRPARVAGGELAAFVRGAARRLGVSERTAWRYEAALKAGERSRAA
jgi:hypothetical protein